MTERRTWRSLVGTSKGLPHTSGRAKIIPGVRSSPQGRRRLAAILSVAIEMGIVIAVIYCVFRLNEVGHPIGAWTRGDFAFAVIIAVAGYLVFRFLRERIFRR